MTQVPARTCPSTTDIPEETGTALATCCIPGIGTATKMLSSDHADRERPTRLMDVLDRVLDQGVVIDAWVRMSAVGIDLITVDARVVVASLDTYVGRADAVRSIPRCGPPMQRASPSDAMEQGANVSELLARGAVVRAAEDYLRELP